MMKISKHLDTNAGDRFVCSCGCGMGSFVEHFDPQLILFFEQYRTLVGGPLFVCSGYRCPRHNSHTPGAAPLSRHCVGGAFDIIVPLETLTPELHFTLIDTAATQVGLVKWGRGWYPVKKGRKIAWIHIDTGTPSQANGVRTWEK